MEQTYFHLGHYTRELKKHLPSDYFKPIPLRLLWIVPHLVVVIGGIYAVAETQWLWIAKLGLSIPIGLSFASLGLLGHEILHGSVTRTPWLRNAAGFLCFMQFNLGPHLWRKWHNVEHHGHTQHEHRDPDRPATLADYERRPGARAILFWFAPFMQGVVTFLSFTVWFSLYSITMLLRYYKGFTPRVRLSAIFHFVTSVSVWLGLAFWIGPLNFVWAYVIPVMIANFVVMSYIATNHVLCPLTPVNDPLANSLTVVTTRWLDMLHFNFSHHTEHHLFPAMSPKYAPKVKSLVKQLWPERYHEMAHWKALLCIWRTPRLYGDATHLTDPVRGDDYPVLGHGLNPDELEPRKS